MYKHKIINIRYFLLGLSALLFPHVVSAQLIINEVMQSNIDCVMDEWNQFPDSWVEIHNTSTYNVNANEWRLGTTRDASKAWQMPAANLDPDIYTIAYLDKENSEWHADFRLESGAGCTLYLFHGEEIVDSLPANMPAQLFPGIAWGRRHEDEDVWGWQLTPTPRGANCGTLCDRVLGDPVFSHPSQVMVGLKSISLRISLPEDAPEGTVIHYTTDGSEPTSSSSVWTGRTFTISSSRVVRARLFCDGWISPPAATRSYIFHPREMTLPVISIITDKRYLYDNKIGIYVDGSYSSQTKNYEYDWRRPIYLEFFDAPGSTPALSQLCETRVSGGATRSAALKSLIVYANKRFGDKRFRYEFFPDQRPGEDKFQSLLFRNAGNDFDYLYMRDAIIQRTMATHVDLDWQAWRPAIVYMNGIYKGILNIRERSTTENVRSNYGLDEEEIDMIENMGELKAGTWDNWNAFKAFYNEHGHTWDEYETWMDCEEYINLMLMNLYYNNQDFPGNNIVAWRPRAEGGRWRWIAKDTDFGLGLYGSSASYNTIAWLHTPDYDSNRAWANKSEHTRLFRRLMEDEDFHRRFIDRALVYMGAFMNYEGTWDVWEPMYNEIKTEYPYHRKLFNQWWPNYQDELNTAKSWIKTRTSAFTKQLGEWYSLGDMVQMNINTGCTSSDFPDVEVIFNEVPLEGISWKGNFFTGRQVCLEALCQGATTVDGWRVTTISTGGSATTTHYEGSTCTFNIPSCTSLTIEAEAGTNGIQPTPSPSSPLPVACYGADGVQKNAATPGLNILRLPDGSVKKVFLPN